MNIIDHLSIGVPDIDTATAFYDEILSALGIAQLAKTEAFAAYGKETVQFLIMRPENDNSYSTGNGTHICFVAPSASGVDKFHAKALANGGLDAGAPGPRAAYPIPDVYTAFIYDPFGNKLEAIYNGFNANH